MDAMKTALKGGPLYYMWMSFLLVLIGITAWSYSHQWTEGMVITGLSDQVSWGFYIANFAFFVGIAAAGVLLTVPAYIFHRKDVKTVVVIGEAMALSAVIVAMGFVAVDIGRLDRAWHVMPGLGKFNWPNSMLAWDIVVLNVYLFLNLFIPMYILFKHYQGKETPVRKYFIWIVITCFWAISIHTVTAWLLSSNVARPFWHTALMAPRFISSAFTAGPALMIIILQLVRRYTDYPVSQSVIKMLAIIMAIALQISLYFVAAELFTDFYFEGAHAASMHYLFLGLDGFDGLKSWIWTAVGLNLVALTLLMIHKTRENMVTLNIACVLGFVGIWIEKGMGLVVTGFIPTPLGEIFEYSPTLMEIGVSVGIYALGAFVFTILTKVAIEVELGRIGKHKNILTGVGNTGARAE
ncbi:MAG: polysulfide reductase NrfD [Thiohalomonas sp.]|nr:polysulfide reductase NrfD [Thiohalomonas sp.]